MVCIMTDQKKYISVLLIVLLASLSGCKEKQQETSEIKDKYALPSGYTGSLNPVAYDFEYNNSQWVGVDASEIEKFLGIQRTIYEGHCGILDFEKKTLSVRITGTKKDRVLKFSYLGNHRFAFLDEKGRGYVAKLQHLKNPSLDEDRHYYYFYPLSDISDEKKIDNLDHYNTTYDFRMSDLENSYKSMSDCEQETIEQEKVQQSIDEEHERVKGDLAPP
ncbi:hypothetical protein LEP1GSC024_0002 [Leptospira noguchii str. 2001034031]|uniref:Uncharacterized protein n=2 Tax=Leptospira noguchii TaxID=28182 RepID=M6Y924_9LEPT|nr:hypothetical protein LEP1GSC024_0002 [Leptospira noguchii str. 2001034031]